MTSASNLVPYTIDEHRHRFAAWAAGRAASVRNCRFSVAQARILLEATGLQHHLAHPDRLPMPQDIDECHRVWRTTIINAAKAKYNLVLTHGVAAKLINVYLKAAFVCGGYHTHPRVQALHPPIDSLLLDELSLHNFGGKRLDWDTARKLRWSKLNCEQYESIITAIRISLPDAPLWEIEQYWRGYQTGEQDVDAEE
ncbi:MAG: hypothetical protein MUD01_16890 [Chloroflexaceae bacterium]|jgi:hypothetical protein|nr:hypothetical protein [Chloroflexaceae bacterium]